MKSQENLAQGQKVGKLVGRGLIAARRKTIHSHSLLENEEAVEIKEMVERTIHPQYDYKLEDGSFTAWERSQLKPQ